MSTVAIGVFAFCMFFVFWFLRSHEIFYSSTPDATMGWLKVCAIFAVIAILVDAFTGDGLWD